MFPVSPAAPPAAATRPRIPWSRTRKLCLTGAIITASAMALTAAYVAGQDGHVTSEGLFWVLALIAVGFAVGFVTATIGDHLAARIDQNGQRIDRAADMAMSAIHLHAEHAARQVDNARLLADLAQAVEDLRDAISAYGDRREATGHATGVHAGNGGRLSRVD